MVDDDVQYEFKSARAIRGAEARSIAKWQKAGWELVDQSAGVLHTTLNFRRVKPKVPWLPIAVLGGVVLVLAIIGGIASALGGGDDKAPASTKPAATASEKSSETPTPSEDSSETPKPREESSETPKPEASESSKSDTQQVLTAANNKEFAALLAVSDGCDETIEPFAAKYGDRTVEFDGSIAAMANHDDYDTRYDILMYPGDRGPESVRGPAFKFADVNAFDLHLTGANVPDSVGLGDLVHVVARVGEYNPVQCMFFLEPVSTEIR